MPLVEATEFFFDCLPRSDEARRRERGRAGARAAGAPARPRPGPASARRPGGARP